ncbi:MAG: DUF1588 domain-containing protein [Akkermansiaceae bacterium]|nr:DUF1588 domain-containing protein [Akkermansiaceae bacterium]MDG1364347.1 DUF1588 domain-containing protein [Akkermansiaceae bacterium]
MKELLNPNNPTQSRSLKDGVKFGFTLIATTLMVTPCHAEKEVKHGDFKLSPEMTKMLYQNCYSCHDEFEQEGDIRLDQLEKLPLDARLDLLNKMQEKLHFQEMPPKKETEQPTEAERTGMLNWLSVELKKHDASKLEDKLRTPGYGNYVNHQTLFSGKYADVPGFTYDRRWLISEFICDIKFNKLTKYNSILDSEGHRRPVPHFHTGFRLNLTNPFLLPTNSGVRYYANETLTGGHLLTMLANAKDTANHMTESLARRDRRFLPAVSAIMAMEDAHRKTLGQRENFLVLHAERLLIELYGDKHSAMLPKFVPTKVEAAVTVKGAKKAIFDAAKPSNDELDFIFRAVVRYMDNAKTNAELIAMCQRQWFMAGHNERKIQSRIAFMANYMDEGLKIRIKKGNFKKRYKAHDYKPPNDEEMALIRASILKHRKQGDSHRAILDKCAAEWDAGFLQDRIEAGPPSDEQVVRLVEELFQMILERSPTTQEWARYASLTRSYIDSLGNLKAIKKLIQTIILRTDFVYRSEFGQGEADDHGRRMLSPHDASYAIAYALTDSSPDAELVKAVKEGKLNTREDYKREVIRMLKRRDQYYVVDEKLILQTQRRVASVTNMPIRELRFFREFFGYPNMLPIFKDNKRFGKNYDNEAKQRLLVDADKLVERILESDQNVFEKLLTTDNFHVYSTHEVTSFFNIKLDNWKEPRTQPTKVEHRKGILTHPAWLIAHSKNTETDPIHRGKWILEKLLAGTIPDVPITVDANVPEDPHKTLRQRLDAKTTAKYCWTCHQKMNPLGLPFEMYDDFGRFRKEEALEYPEHLIKKNPDKGSPQVDLRDVYKSLPVDSRGHLKGTGDDKLDGEVDGAPDLINRLAKSDRVRQSIIRHAFRYFMGRNEFLSDSKTLIDADKAYMESGGSFDAVIISLLTSDSFIYRKTN